MKILIAAGAALALLCSFGGRGSTTFSFDSGDLQPGFVGSFTIPGAPAGAKSVVLEIEFDRAFEGFYQNNGPAPTEVEARFFPSVDIGVPGSPSYSLPAFITTNTVVGSAPWTYASDVESRTVEIVITDPVDVRSFRQKTIDVPLVLRGGHTLLASGGLGTSGVSAEYAWRGTVTYQ